MDCGLEIINSQDQARSLGEPDMEKKMNTIATDESRALGPHHAPEVYEECGHNYGECSCYDCEYPGCDDYRVSLNARYCVTHEQKADQ